MPQNNTADSKRVPSARAEQLLGCAWTAYRSQLTPLALLGAGVGILNVMIYLLPTAPRLGMSFLLYPVVVLGFYRACLEALCGKAPRAGLLLCGAKSLRGYGQSLLLGLPALGIELLALVAAVAVAGLSQTAGQDPNRMTLSLSVSVGMLLVRVWYLYRFCLVEYGWLTGRAKNLSQAVKLSMGKTRGTFGYAVRFGIGLLLCYLPVAAAGSAADALIVRAGMDAATALSVSVTVRIVLNAAAPFYVMAAMAFAAGYFDGIQEEFSSTEGLV